MLVRSDAAGWKPAPSPSRNAVTELAATSGSGCSPAWTDDRGPRQHVDPQVPAGSDDPTKLDARGPVSTCRFQSVPRKYMTLRMNWGRKTAASLDDDSMPWCCRGVVAVGEVGDVLASTVDEESPYRGHHGG